MISKTFLTATFTVTFALAGVNVMAQANFDDSQDSGAVYTMSNAASGNQVLVFNRDGQGKLTSAGAVATYGFGLGGGVDPLGSQHSLVLTEDDQWLLVANAGSNEISVMRVDNHGLKFAGKAGSGGTMPTSIAISHDLVYVLNGGAAPNITGFRFRRDGRLDPIPNSTRALNGAAFGEVSFDTRGESLIVTDKGNSNILVFGVNDQGLPSAQAVVNPSNGAVPFGVSFDRHDHLLVVEVGADAVSSYSIEHNDMLHTISTSVANGQKAACWIANGNHFVFTANPGTHSVSSYSLDAWSGELKLISGVAATGTTPLDLATTSHEHYLYALDVGNLGIDAFRVERDGSLTNLGSVAGGVQTYSQGIAVR